MKLLVILLAYFSITSFASAQTIGKDQTAVLKVLEQVFAAMEAGDDKALTDILLADTNFDRISPNKPLKRSDVRAWVNWVSGLKPGQAQQKIFDVKVQVEGPLAVAWAPFTISMNGKPRSCGITQFTLVKQSTDWKVAYIIDTHTPQKCQAMNKK